MGKTDMDKTGSTVMILKELIDENGPEYLKNNPYKVYLELVKDNGTDKKLAGAILCYLVSGQYSNKIMDPEELTDRIMKNCGFNKKLSGDISKIFTELYSPDNNKRWKKKRKEGFKEFMQEELKFIWNGFYEWDEGNGTIDCTYGAEIVLMPSEKLKEDKSVRQMLKENPFETKEAFVRYFTGKIRKYLDADFEEYCCADDYYEPYVEDYEPEECLKCWCENNGFELISCDGAGCTGTYDPKFRGWY